MTDQATAPTPNGSGPRARGRGRRFLFIFTIVLAAGLTGALANKAFSHWRGFGPGWHSGFMMRGPIDPAWIEDRGDRMTRHLAVEVDATAEQEEKLRAVAKAAIKDLMPLREKHVALRQQGRQLLTQPAVTRADIEKLRSEQMALADAASRRIAQALGDAAEILTPEQRRKLDDLLPRPGSFWPAWRRG